MLFTEILNIYTNNGTEFLAVKAGGIYSYH
jgi:hypothetical protein